MPLPNCLRQPIRLWPRFPRGVASAGFGWVPAASDPQVNGMFPSIVSAQPQASDRNESPGIRSGTRQRGPQKEWSGGGEGGRDPRSHLPSGRAGAGLKICPMRPAEGAAARASGPTVTRPLGGRLHLQTQNQNPEAVYPGGWRPSSP